MKILITGSNGLVGSQLMKELSKTHKVEGFDLVGGQNILDYEQCLSHCKGKDLVIHCAAVLEEENPALKTVNVQGTKNILNASIKSNVPRFIFLSTTGVYGDCKEKVDEKSEFDPVTEYEKSKAEAEAFLRTKKPEININIIRPAIIVADNKYWKSIISLVKKNFPLIGSGKNKWQTVFIDDVVDAISFIIQKNPTNEDFIVAEEAPITLNEVVLTIKETLGLPKRIFHFPFFLAFPFFLLYGLLASLVNKKTIISAAYIKRLSRNRNYSVDKLKKLGFTPKYNFKTAIKLVLIKLKVANR